MPRVLVTRLSTSVKGMSIETRVTNYSRAPGYVARLRYREENAPDGRWRLGVMRVVLAEVEKPMDEVRALVEKFMERIVEENMTWDEIVSAFIELMDRVAPPYSTPGADVEIHDTGGDYPEISIDLVYRG